MGLKSPYRPLPALRRRWCRTYATACAAGLHRPVPTDSWMPERALHTAGHSSHRLLAALTPLCVRYLVLLTLCPQVDGQRLCNWMQDRTVRLNSVSPVTLHLIITGGFFLPTFSPPPLRSSALEATSAWTPSSSARPTQPMSSPAVWTEVTGTPPSAASTPALTPTPSAAME